MSGDVLSRSEINTISRTLSSPDWVLEPELYVSLPKMLQQIALAKVEDGEGAGRYRYSPRHRMAAAKLLAQLHAANQRNNPAPQPIDVRVSGDVQVAIEELSQQPQEVLEQLRDAYRKIREISQPSDN